MDQPPEIFKRIFIVGCSRSGTTLLQKFLAGHPRVHTFPETAFFKKLFRVPQKFPQGFPPVWTKVGLTLGKERKRLKVFLEAIDRQDLKENFPAKTYFLRRSVTQFVKLLDQLTQEAHKDIWLEKTPGHFRYVPFIQRRVPSSHIVHMIRDGREVVASLQDRARTYSDRFSGQDSLMQCIGLWNTALTASLKAVGRPGQSFVFYKDLIRSPSEVTRKLCQDIGVTFLPEMMDVNPTYFIKASEEWKNKVKTNSITVEEKFTRLFDKPTQTWIEERLDFSTYDHLYQKCGSQNFV